MPYRSCEKCDISTVVISFQCISELVLYRERYFRVFAFDICLVIYDVKLFVAVLRVDSQVL